MGSFYLPAFYVWSHDTHVTGHVISYQLAIATARGLARILHAWAVEVLNTQLPYTHIQHDHDSNTAPLNRIECTYLRSEF